MKTGVVIFLLISSVFAHYNEQPSSPSFLPRIKRSAVGALHIVTNHAQPIHADVKPESSIATDNTENTEKVIIEKPCSKDSVAHVEPGLVGFKVTPPEDAITTYEIKSLRKSLPYTPPTTLTLIRSVSRVVTLIVLFVSAVLEFYPTFYELMCTIYSFINK